MAADIDTPLHIPARDIPPPASLSPQGRGYLAAAALRISAAQSAESGPAEAALAASAEAAVQFLRPMAAGFKGTVETIDLPHGAKLYRMTPNGRTGRLAEVAYFDIHGGGFVAGGGEMCRLLAQIRAAEHGAEVFSVDYRLAPANAYPAALDDCMAAYREVLKHCAAKDLVVAGGSAGANLAAATLLRARDEGLPLPAALVLQTPGVDLTRSGDTHQTNRHLDVNLWGGADVVQSYVGDADPTDPYVSPLFGDFSQSWPPTILTSGTRDLLLSDTVRMHRALRRAGVAAELHVSEASPHGGFMGAGAPEDMDTIAECRRFVRAAWGLPV